MVPPTYVAAEPKVIAPLLASSLATPRPLASASVVDVAEVVSEPDLSVIVSAVTVAPFATAAPKPL